jgi:hypothetical protein
MRQRVFEKIRFDKPIMQVLQTSEYTQPEWNCILQRELVQDTVYSKQFKCYFRKKNIVVIAVIGDVLCIELDKIIHPTAIWRAPDSIKMYVNAAALDTLFQRMRAKPGKQLQVFVSHVNRHFHTIYDAAVLINGFLQRESEKKKLLKARESFHAHFMTFTPTDRSFIRLQIKDRYSDSELLAWCG